MAVREVISELRWRDENSSHISDKSWDNDTFEWDSTDIGLSTQEGLEWLRHIGVLPKDVGFTDLNSEQQQAVRILLDKIEQKNISLQQLKSGSFQKEFAKDIEYISQMVGKEAKKQASLNSPPKHDDHVEERGHLPDNPAHDMVQLRSATERLALAWAHRQEAMKCIKQLDDEMRNMLQTSRARLQAELVALRRENATLRLEHPISDMFVKLQAEKELTTSLQSIIDQRDAEIARLSTLVQQQTDELSVLRSARDLSHDGMTPAQRRSSIMSSRRSSFLSQSSSRPSLSSHDLLNTRRRSSITQSRTASQLSFNLPRAHSKAEVHSSLSQHVVDL